MTKRKANISWDFMFVAACLMVLRHPIADAFDCFGLYWGIFDSITTFVLLLFSKALSMTLVGNNKIDKLKIDLFVIYLWDDLFDRLFFDITVFQWNDVIVGAAISLLYLVKHKETISEWTQRLITERE